MASITVYMLTATHPDRTEGFTRFFIDEASAKYEASLIWWDTAIEPRTYTEIEAAPDCGDDDE